MATGATGTPTSLGIPKYATSADAPNGTGFNSAMDVIDTLLQARVSLPSGIASGETMVYNGSALARSSVTRLTTVRPQDLQQDAATSGQSLVWNGSIWAPATTSSILDRVTATTDVANTVTKTALYTYSVPGNTLSTNKMLHLTVVGDVLNNSGGGDAPVLRLEYGATVLATGTPNNFSSNATRRIFHLECWLYAQGSTSSQTGRMFFLAGAAATAGSWQWDLRPAGDGSIGVVHGTSAEDSTASKNLLLTAQWGTATATRSVRLTGAVLELN